jgi:DNA-binding HxlR family transcriptional regulator
MIGPFCCGLGKGGETGQMVHAEISEFDMIAGTRAVLDLLDGKWTVEVLYLLATGKRRYSEVFYDVGAISKKTLTRTLRQLEANGLVARKIYPEVPPRVEYSLTPRGWSITGPLMGMYEWAAEHLNGESSSPLCSGHAAASRRLATGASGVRRDARARAVTNA